MITLNELAKLTRSALGKAVVLDLLRQSPLLGMLPIDSIDALKVTDTRWQTLPSAGTRKIGGAYVESTGKVEQIEDTLHIYGGDITVDPMLLKVKALTNPLELQTKMKVAAVAVRFNYDLVQNDHATGDIDGFEGIAKRVATNPARCTIDLAVATDALKVLASTANEHLFIDAMHQGLNVLGAVYGADAIRDLNIIALMNEQSYLGIGKVLRRVALLSTAQDAYGRVWSTFGPAKLVDVGFRGDQTTEIITNVEDPGDGGNDASSIYLVRLGGIVHKDASGKTSVKDDDGLRVIQLNGTSPEPFDPTPGSQGAAGVAPAINRRIDWAVGLKQAGRYSVVRIKGFKMAAA